MQHWCIPVQDFGTVGLHPAWEKVQYNECDGAAFNVLAITRLPVTANMLTYSSTRLTVN